MILSKIIGRCPKCNADNKYGNVLISKNTLLRGCQECGYKKNIKLPKIRKKILYLDQFFFSDMLRGKNEKINQAKEKIERLMDKQIIVAPYSSIHEDETSLWRGYDNKNKSHLYNFLKRFSRGHEFIHQHKIEHDQILTAFKNFIDKNRDEIDICQRDAFYNDVNEWDNYYSVNMKSIEFDVNEYRKTKHEASSGLINIFDAWRADKTTFHEDVALEVQENIRNYSHSYYTHAYRIATGDYMAFLDSPVISKVCESLLRCLPNDLGHNEKIQELKDFFQSKYFYNVPYTWITCHFYAALKDRVKKGQYKNKEKALKKFSGFFLDVNHIASYAPYCDAIFIDKAMHSFADDPNVSLSKKYRIEIFSMTNWCEFTNWLDLAESSITEEHSKALAEI